MTSISVKSTESLTRKENLVMRQDMINFNLATKA